MASINLDNHLSENAGVKKKKNIGNDHAASFPF